MNLYMPDLDRKPSRDEAEAALATLKLWAARASESEIVALDPQAGALVGQGYPVLSRDYPAEFRADAAYKDSLPDLQNGPASLIVGDRKVIQHVGISNFRLPIRYRTRDGLPQAGSPLTLETSVTGTVSLEAEKKGINMSRIMRSFYAHAEREFSFQVIEHALDDYKRDLDSFDARIQMRLSFPMKVDSLRSGLSGWQYYDIALELVDRAGKRKRILHLDFVYSSTCPCSLELSEHARRARGQLATPHSQRSVARISVEVKDGRCLWFEDLIDLFGRAGASAEEMAQLEELYGIKRAAAVKEASDRISGSLRDLLDELNFGDSGLSLRDRRANLMPEYQALSARVQAGDTTAFDAFAEAARSMLEIEREIFGSQSGYFARFNEVKGISQGALSEQERITNAAMNRDSPFADGTTANAPLIAAIDGQTNQVVAQLQAMNDNFIRFGNIVAAQGGKITKGNRFTGLVDNF